MIFPSSKLRRQTKVALVAFPLSSGIGLLVYFLCGISLWYGLLLAGAIGFVSTALVYRSLTTIDRRRALYHARIGAISGVIATFCYDLSRLFLVEGFHIKFWPFEAFKRFGALLVGESQSESTKIAVGFLYHLVNGVGFAVAFAVLIHRPSIAKGILWAMFLEFTMLVFYPSWLQIQAMGEFTEVSVFGHFVYGASLGSLLRLLQNRYPLKEA